MSSWMAESIALQSDGGVDLNRPLFACARHLCLCPAASVRYIQSPFKIPRHIEWIGVHLRHICLVSRSS